MSQTLRRVFRRTAAVACLCGASASAGCAPQVSTQQEVAIGADYSRQINRQMPMLNDQATLSYVNQIGSQLAAIADPRGIRYHFYVVNSDVVNAFALPGGYVYVNRGIIERADNLSEFAGVLAHEIGHVAERHSIEQLQRRQPSRVEQWFSTHPTTQERVTNTRAIIAQTPGAQSARLVSDTRAFQSFRSRVTSLPAPPDRRR